MNMWIPKLLEVLAEEEMRGISQQVLQAHKFTDIMLIKTLFYTGVHVSKLVNIWLGDVDLERSLSDPYQRGGRRKDRLVPFSSPCTQAGTSCELPGVRPHATDFPYHPRTTANAVGSQHDAREQAHLTAMAQGLP